MFTPLTVAVKGTSEPAAMGGSIVMPNNHGFVKSFRELAVCFTYLCDGVPETQSSQPACAFP
jgi:hypothetical protein